MLSIYYFHIIHCFINSMFIIKLKNIWLYFTFYILVGNVQPKDLHFRQIFLVCTIKKKII